MTTGEENTRLGKEFNISDVFVEQEIKAGALGAGIDIFQSTSSMIIDIGGGSTDIGVLSLGDIVVEIQYELQEDITIMKLKYISINMEWKLVKKLPKKLKRRWDIKKEFIRRS